MKDRKKGEKERAGKEVEKRLPEWYLMLKEEYKKRQEETENSS